MMIKSLLLFSFLACFFSHIAVRGDNLINPAKVEMFVDELPRFPKLPAYQIQRGVPVAANLTIGMFEKTVKFHRDLPPTTVFAFGTSKETATVPGPSIQAIQGIATYITWENFLPSQHILPFDTSITIPRPKYGGVATAVHLHGGIHPPTSDGNANAWFTNSYRDTGSAFVSRTSFYPNVQEPGNLWYHDHAVGITRVNLLTGLLGTYIICNASLEGPLNLPSGAEFDRHIVIFDRSLWTNGSIYLNSTGDNPSIHPQWNPEYFGDVMLVNGKAWPFLNVTRQKYRFRIINACNARYFSLFFPNGLSFVHIGSDSTYLSTPVTSSRFLLAPSEIADVIVDFSQSSTDSVILSNDAPYPYPNGTATDQLSGKIVKFIIEPEKVRDPTTIPTKLTQYPRPMEDQATTTRYITMYEANSATGNPTHLTLNNKTFEDPVTEMPKAGTSELWHVINLTPDNHPLHIHLAVFSVLEQRQLVNLTTFQDCMNRMNDAVSCNLAGHAVGTTVDVPVYERGWKNVFKVMPGYVTKILVRFSLLTTEGGYPFNVTGAPGFVYHCHILDHEDNVMMRPMLIIP